MMPDFRRGLSKGLIDALRLAYQQGGWWTGIVNDQELFVTPRNERVCAYYRGNCLLELRARNHQLVGKVHYKYVLKPDLSPPYWNVTNGEVHRPGDDEPFISHFSDLDRIKRASKPYAGEEKHGVSEMIARNPNIIDVEVAFGETDELSGGQEDPIPASDEASESQHRVDFVAIERRTDRPKLVFFEVKHFANKGLRCKSGLPDAVKQIKRYAQLLKENEPGIIEAYRRHCADMLESDCVPRNNKRCEFLRKIKDAPTIELDVLPRLIVFGFDADQKPGKATGKFWKKHKDKLEELLEGRVLFRGKAGDVTL